MKKYQRIANLLLQYIDEGYYTSRLPNIREMMKLFNASQSTINQALQQLIKMNKIYNKPNIGYFIITKNPSDFDSNDYFDFSTSSTSWTDFPFESYIQCLETSFKNDKQNLFTYGSVTGSNLLKKSFKSILEDDQIFTKEEQIVITSGTQQALHILSLMMINNNDKILVEQPTYHQMNHLIERLNMNHTIYNRNLDDINTHELENIIKSDRPKYVYLMPRLHNPLGTTMNETEKLILLKMANKYDFYIIEDDYLGDFENNNSYKSIYEMDNSGRVIYLKSFSKIMFPGQRLGFVVLPITLVQKFVDIKEIVDIQTNVISQSIMQTFISSGLYDYHKDKIIDKHQQKVNVLHQSLNKHFKNYEFNDNHKMHTVIKLPKTINMNSLYNNLSKSKILVDDYKQNYISNYKDNHKFIKLNTSNIAESKIDTGLKLIKNCIDFSKEF
ncbi:PLP-dependent aminotransferase family protein [Mammaliicoccus sciuri]|uniref:aminotransferase-like domain-containing protein n=1 Tax=Mammaliicoccus sciuri TaxID=1296 RepID=UPI0013307E74|nr:PLP-dependent aminotransferase family protein [Mammaliicoccus sciuri]MCJ1747956.1 PLP-dependent aminotransferase family protein [Mammaliicoccus sciuri]